MLTFIRGNLRLLCVVSQRCKGVIKNATCQGLLRFVTLPLDIKQTKCWHNTRLNAHFKRIRSCQRGSARAGGTALTGSWVTQILNDTLASCQQTLSRFNWQWNIEIYWILKRITKNGPERLVSVDNMFSLDSGPTLARVSKKTGSATRLMSPVAPIVSLNPAKLAESNLVVRLNVSWWNPKDFLNDPSVSARVSSICKRKSEQVHFWNLQDLWQTY